MITSEQMKAARALLRWEQKDLAASSGVPLQTIKRLETKPGMLSARNSTVVSLVNAFGAHGVEFSFDEEQGVRLKRHAS